MNAIFFTGLILATLLLGLNIGRIRSLPLRRAVGWLTLLVSVALVEVFSRGLHPVVRMLWLIGAMFWSMKGIVYAEWLAAHPAGLSGARRLAFWMLWPGMRPDLFDRDVTNEWKSSIPFLAKGVVCVAAGLLAMSGSVVLREFVSPVTPFADWITMLPALVGLSLCLHFGLFNLIAGFWRGLGLRSYSLFRSPLESKSLEEFWGRRWNLAFTEMTAWSVFRPLKGIAGIGIATFAAFVVSGLLHELEITVPVSRRYGLPTLYFLLQWSGIVLEQRHLSGANSPTWLRRTWTAICIVLPLPLVFPPEFVRGICEPVVDALTRGL
jgi:hypothetical protein